ncbi:MAG TPA: MMPL family transporter, partial [Methanomassiliicoccales archaeon]|nr:MMPL family transporter [Methanomassiliicoccales archaeon]
AAEIIEENFQGTVANSTLIIVITSDNMTSPEARDFVLQLQKELEAADLAYFEGVSSIYSYSGMVLYAAITELGPQMYEAEEQVNQSAFLLWGIPAMHAWNWAGYHDSDPNETNATVYAYQSTSATLRTYLPGMDANITAIALGYYSAFADAWNATSDNTTWVANPLGRAEHCVGEVAPGFITGLPLDASYQQAMLAVLYGFNITNFNSQQEVHNFTMGMVSTMAGISNTTFLQQIYDLGPNYSSFQTQSRIYALAEDIVSFGTLDTYPIPIPDQLLKGFVSPDNRTMLMTLSFSKDVAYITDEGETPMTDMVPDIRDIIREVGAETGFEGSTYLTGAAAISKDMEDQSMDDMMLIEPITIIVILVLMGYLFRTVVGQFVPLGAVGIALGVSQAMVFVLASTIMDVNYITTTLLFALLMGVGTDYSIFIMTRYREERIKGANREQAVHTALTWAGESVATSAATVMIAFLAMTTVNFSFIRNMGIIVALAIFIALMVALTLIPSFLMLVGNRIF